MESNPNYNVNNNQNNKNIVFTLNQIFESNGRNKQAWGDLLYFVNNTNSLLSIVYYFNQKVRNEPSNPLTLDIIDFLIDFGPLSLIREISKIEFMNNIFYLLKKSSGSSPDVQKKGIYLINKWKDKCTEYPNENFAGFIKNFNELNSHHISLPPPGFKLLTYENNISPQEVNIAIANAEQNQNLINQQNNNFNNNNFNNNFQNNNNNYVPEYKSKYACLPNNNNINNINNLNNINNINNIDDNNNRINNLPNFPNEQLNFKEEKNNLNNIRKPNYDDEEDKINKPNENDNRMVYPNYDENQKNDKEKINNYGQNNGGTPNGNNNNNDDNNNQNEEQDMGVPPPVIEKKNDDKDLYNAPFINKELKTPLGNKNPLPKEINNYNTIYNNELKGINNGNNIYQNANINSINNGLNNNFNNNKNNNNIYNSFNNNNFNNNNFSNNSFNNKNYQNNNPSQDIMQYKQNWLDKINLYNQLMNQGYSDYNKENLRNGIQIILIELDNIPNIMFNNNRVEDQEIILKIKSDMLQTCSRYEKFINNESYEGFFSAFDGNRCIYTFNKENLLLDKNSNQNYKEIQNNINQEEKNRHKYVKELKKFGGFMKKHIFSAGKMVKNSTIKGYNYVKDKVNNEEKTKDKVHDEVFKNYMDNIDSNNMKYNYQNNQNNNNFNNKNYNNSFNDQNNKFNNNNQNNNNINNQNNNYNNQNNNFNNNNQNNNNYSQNKHNYNYNNMNNNNFSNGNNNF